MNHQVGHIVKNTGEHLFAVVVPLYNEAERFDLDVFYSFINEEQIDFCFVNDGSTDNTITLLLELQKKLGDKVHVLDYKKNMGKAESVRQGFLHMEKENKYNFIGFMDADLATPLFEIANVKQIIAEKDKKVVFGSRIIHLGAKIKRKYTRYLIGRVFATIVAQLIIKLPIYDTQCGFKFFDTKLVPDVFKEPFISPWFFDVEIFKRISLLFGKDYLLDNGYEYFLSSWEDKYGSKLKLIDFLKTPLELIKLYFAKY